MRKIFCVLLALMTTCAPCFADEAAGTAGEELFYEVDYDAVAIQLPMTEWMISVPAEWDVQAVDYEPGFTVSCGDAIHIEGSVLESDFEQIYDMYSMGLNFQEDFITYKTVNGFSVMSYCEQTEFFDIGDGLVVEFSISLAAPLLEDYDAARETVWQMISSMYPMGEGE